MKRAYIFTPKPKKNDLWKKRRADPVYSTGNVLRNIHPQDIDIHIRLKVGFSSLHYIGGWKNRRYYVKDTIGTELFLVWDICWYVNADIFIPEFVDIVNKLDALPMPMRDMVRLINHGIAGVAVGI